MISSQNRELYISKIGKTQLFFESAGGKASDKTVFKTFLDDKNWYFTFECEENFFYPKHANFNDKLFEGDIVELMITLGDKNRYLEVEVNQNNAAYLAIIDNLDGEGKINIKFLDKNFIFSSVKLAINKWFCDIIIPFERLEELGFDKKSAFFNAHRQDFDESGNLNLYSLSPTMSRTFHKIDAFLNVSFV